MKRTYLVLAVCAVLLILAAGTGASYILLSGRLAKRLTFSDFLPKKTVADIKLSKDVLYVGQPVTSVDGRLTAVNGSTITVTHHYSLASSVGEVSADQQAKDVNFNFNLTPQTKILRPPTYIPYLFKSQPANANETLAAGSLRPGMFVSVVTNTDLRIAQSNPFTAASVEVTRIGNNVQGKISQISGNTFTLTAFPPPNPASFPPGPSPAQKEYTVKILPDTEIARRQYNVGNPEKLSAGDLTRGMTVTVYGNEDAGVETQLSALLIVPVDSRPVPSPTKSP